MATDSIPSAWLIQERCRPEIVVWWAKTSFVCIAIGVVAVGRWWPWLDVLAARIPREML